MLVFRSSIVKLLYNREGAQPVGRTPKYARSEYGRPYYDTDGQGGTERDNQKETKARLFPGTS